MWRAATAALLLLVSTVSPAQTCPTTGVHLQVLGSGGPELGDKRASSAYLIWIDGLPRALIDVGGGSALRFGESGAHVADLDVILLTHLHADHTSDLPALIKSSWFEDRRDPLPLYGPPGNNLTPSTVTFVRTLFDPTRGAYRYLGDFLKPLGRDTYKLKPYDVSLKKQEIKGVIANGRIRAVATSVTHGALPALAWRIEAEGHSIVFTGDGAGSDPGLVKLAQNADILVAHNAVPEQTDPMARALHMPPSVIGRLAAQAQARQLVLSHRMLRTLGREDETLAQIRKQYSGPTSFANDLDCFQP